MFSYFVLLFFVLGLFLGRWAYFLVLVYEGRSRFLPYRCSSCKYFLSIFPWPIRSSSCSRCYRKLDSRCIIIEWAMAFTLAILVWMLGFSWWSLEVGIFCFMAMVACVVDIRRTILPDTFTLGGIVIGLLGAWLNPDRSFLPAFTGVVVGGGGLATFSFVYYFLRKKEGMGLGDVKMIAWIGALVGWKSLIGVLFLACVLALLFWFIRLGWGKKIGVFRQEMAFGPYLALATYAIILASSTGFFNSYLIFNLK